MRRVGKNKRVGQLQIWEMDEGDRDAAEQECIVLRLRQRVIASANCCEALEKETRDELQRLICLVFPATEEGLQKRKVKETNLQTYLGPKQILLREPDPWTAQGTPWRLFRSLSPDAWLCLVPS